MKQLFTIITAAAVALLVVFLAPQTGTNQGAKETAAERVLRTGVLRCGYTAWDPMLKVDPGSRKISGLAYDTIEATAKYLGLKVEWTEELGWGDFTQALQNGRIDAFCAGGTPSAERARVTLTTTPFMFSQMVMVVRSNDARFDHNPELLNSPHHRVGQVDGTTALKIMKNRFPAANFIGYPESIPLNQMPLDVAQNKTDVTLIPLAMMALYNQQHPGALKAIPHPAAKRMLPNIFFVAKDEWQLREILNSGLTDVLDTGLVAQSIERHKVVPGAYILPDSPYQK